MELETRTITEARPLTCECGQAWQTLFEGDEDGEYTIIVGCPVCSDQPEKEVP